MLSQLDLDPLDEISSGVSSSQQGVGFDAAELFHGRYLLGHELKAVEMPFKVV